MLKGSNTQNLPQAILDAQSNGRLVFFVGAGASVDTPSDLPLFNGLARKLAAMARVPFSEDVAIDFFLGSMPENFDTHRHTRDLIAIEDSTANATHAAIIRLSSSAGQMRIVTTNFDDHLSSASVALGIEVPDKWIGPALPLGDAFSGIVHLHGSVVRDSRELVLTDRDFGRAYLTHAWATRFLLPMFQNFTVLFIGYSHDDPIMRYLALGLPSGTPRFAFASIEEANDSKWSRLGVQTIGYPVQDHDHSALVGALEAWDVRVRMGLTDHRARIDEIVMGGPTLTPVDHDYLASRLEITEGASDFARSVSAVDLNQQIAWLRWTENLPEFQAIFTGKEEDAATIILGNWFCQTFIASPELHGAALQTVMRLGQAFSSSLFHSAGWAANTLGNKDVEAGRRWKAFLATSIHGHSAPVATESLLSYLPEDHPEHVSTLRAALKPSLKLRRRSYLDAANETTVPPDAEVQWTSSADTLTAHVRKVVEMAAPGESKLGLAIEDSLISAYDLLDAYHGEREWDPLSFRRSAIEPHSQNQFRDPIDAVIDGVRTYGEKALMTSPDVLDRWWSFDRTLFRRLALHLLALDASRAADEKITWLLDRSDIYDTDVKHETYRVLSVTAVGASEATRARLLAAAKAGPNFPDDVPNRERHTAYAIYNLLVWLTRVAPEWSEARTAFNAAQVANPDFAPRDHPDLDRWIMSGTWGGKLPMEPEDFIRSVESNPETALDDLLARDYSERSFDEPSWMDALSLVSEVAESRPEVGQRLWALIDGRDDLKSQADELRRATIDGWAKASLDETSGVFAHVATQVPNPESSRSVSRFLLEQIQRQIDSDETPALVFMRRIALALWQEQVASFSHSESDNPFSFAPLYLNSWPGDLAQYWVCEIDRRWRNSRDDWSGLSDMERGALTQLLSGPPYALDATRPAVARYLFFLFSADATFTTKLVLPLFSADTTAALAWNSYLHNPRCNDSLLASGLLDSTVTEWERLVHLSGQDLRNSFFVLVISIVSFAGITPESRKKLLDGSVLANDGAYAAEFAAAAARFVQDQGIDGAEVWKRWLRDHLKVRLRGIPRSSEGEELARWADTVPHVGDCIPEAVELTSNRNIGLGANFFHPNFSQKVLTAHGPILVSHFVERIQNSSGHSYLIKHQVRALIDDLRDQLGETAVKPLVDAAREAGFFSDSSGRNEEWSSGQHL